MTNAQFYLLLSQIMLLGSFVTAQRDRYTSLVCCALSFTWLLFSASEVL